MREELEKNIAEAFPFMRRKGSYGEQIDEGGAYDLYRPFDCDVNDGRFSVIWGLCEEIAAAYKNAGIPIDFVPVQVKEKFGMLRFYYDVGGKIRACLRKMWKVWQIKNRTPMESDVVR